MKETRLVITETFQSTERKERKQNIQRKVETYLQGRLSLLDR